MRVPGRWVLRSLVFGLSLQPFALSAAEPASEPAAEAPAPREIQARAKTREELFLEVFKRPPPDMPVSGFVLVQVDASTGQKVRAVLAPGEQNILLEGKAVVNLLSHRLRTDILQSLERRIDPEGWLSRTAIEEAGVVTSFEARKFEFAMTTAPGVREKNVQYLTGLGDSLRADALRPAAASGFLNFNLKAARRTEGSSGSTNDQSTVAIATDGAVNVMGVVLEGSAFAQTGNAHPFQRGDLRLVYDEPRRALRYSAGDLRYPVVGYQTIIDMGGIGVSRDFSLQPGLQNRQAGRFEFYLERPAEVKVWVNESLVNTLQLPAGTHDIRGLTPVVGLNDTRLVIEDNAGRRETLDFSFIFSPMLLEQGASQFSYNAGFRREARNGGYRYDSGNLVLSASYLEGVSRDTTLGAYLQSDSTHAMLGAQSIHALSSGMVQLDAATSRSGDGKWDLAGKLSWIHIPDLRRGETVQSQLSVEYLGRRFGTINDSTPALDNRINLYASAAFPVGNATTAQLSAYYTPARNAGSVTAHSLIAALTRRWGKYTTTSLSLRQRRSSNGEMQTGLFFGLSFSFSDNGNNFYAAKEIETDTATLNWSSARPSNSTLPYGFASTRLGAGIRDFTAGAGYWGHQGLVEASQNHTALQQQAGTYVRDETALRLQSALVFADGAVGLTRSVAENFAIVKGKEGLARIAMKVDPDGQGGSRAQSGLLSPAVVGDLANYQLRDVRIEPVDPPLGATPEKLTYALAPTYKSGFLLELGKEARIIAVGRLLDSQGRRLAHLPIEIRRLGDPDAKPVSTFTSRSGGFQLPEIKPGRYEVRPTSTTLWDSVVVEIPQTPDGLFRIGDVTVQPK